MGRIAGFLLLMLVTQAGAAEPVPASAAVLPEQGRIGLVLSGGGARGLAHVGVLKVLEAEGIRPDIVVGTSMGSIVGGLYASGYSAGEIELIARQLDWSRTFDDAPPRRHQPYTVRQLDAGLNSDIRLSVTREGISLPRGVLQGQNLGLVLDELFQVNGDSLRLENLPIPFAAVAADLETGQAVVLDKGDVSLAVRASMSIPGALEPVEYGGRLLVDGGIANNMPVDVARAMGADVIIAVDVGAPLLAREQLRSLFSVAQQASGFLVRLNTVEQSRSLGEQDLLLQPALDDYSSLAFDQVDGIILAGEAAAREAFPRVGEIAATAVEAVRDNRPRIDFIEVSNDSVIADEVVRNVIRQPLSAPLNMAMLEEDISRLYGLDYFRQVRYRVVRQGDRHGLLVICRKRQHGTTWLKLGLELSDDFHGNSDFSLGASLRASGLNRLGGTALVRGEVGTSPEIEARFYQPVDYGLRYFIEPAVGYRTEDIEFYLDQFQEEPFARYQRLERWAALSVGRLFWREVAEIRVGVERRRGEYDFRGGIDAGEDEYDEGFYFARIGWDSLDDLGFPREGARWSVTHEEFEPTLDAPDRYQRMHLDGTLALSFGRHTLLLEADASTLSDEEADVNDPPFIGGFLELSGLPPRSRFGRHRALARAVFYRQLNEQGPLPLGVPVYMGGSLEKGNVWLERESASWGEAISAGSVFIGARTPLGPAYLAYGVTEDEDYSFSLFLGQRFR